MGFLASYLRLTGYRTQDPDGGHQHYDEQERHPEDIADDVRLGAAARFGLADMHFVVTAFHASISRAGA